MSNLLACERLCQSMLKVVETGQSYVNIALHLQTYEAEDSMLFVPAFLSSFATNAKPPGSVRLKQGALYKEAQTVSWLCKCVSRARLCTP